MHLGLLLSPWSALLVLQGILTAVLFTKRMWRSFPFFFGYCTFSFLAAIVLSAALILRLPRTLYFDAFWFNEAGGLLLGLSVVYEIFEHLLKPYPALKKAATWIFGSSVLLLLVLGLIVVYCQPSGERSPLMAAFLAVDEASRILEVGLLSSVFLFAGAFGLHWRQYVFGIALGLGIFVTVELVSVTMRLQFGMGVSSIVNTIRAVSFSSTLFIWIAYVLAPDLAATTAELPKRAELEQWNRAVMELIYQ